MTSEESSPFLMYPPLQQARPWGLWLRKRCYLAVQGLLRLLAGWSTGTI